jgi:predicted nucleic acid-binding protein
LAVGAAHGLSAYDAAYLVLATDTGASLLTRDAGLARAAHATGVPLG